MNFKEAQLPNLNERPLSLRFEFTRDETAITRFIDLRQKLYAVDPRFIGFREFHRETIESYTYPHHHTLLMYNHGECIGGGRLTLIKKGEDMPYLPLEQDFMDNINSPPPFRLRDIMPECDFKNYHHVEASRMLVHPDYRHKTECIVKMFTLLFREALDLGAGYFFAMSDLARLRLYKKIATVQFNNIAKIVKVPLPDKPEFEGLRMHILVWDIRHDKKPE